MAGWSGPEPGSANAAWPGSALEHADHQMSERITWVNCPECGAHAAVGWDGDHPVEFDCAAGCSLGASDVRRRFGSTDSSGLAPQDAEHQPVAHALSVTPWVRHPSAASASRRVKPGATPRSGPDDSGRRR